MDTTIVHFRFDMLIHQIAAHVRKAKQLINFEHKLSRRTKIILAIVVLAIWLATPSAVKILVVSAKCVNYGIGLIIHGLVFYKKAKPFLGITVNLGRPLTIALGTTLIISGLIMRGNVN